MITVIYAYRLKDKTNIEDFITWSKEIDQKTVKSFNGIESFEVYLVKGPEHKLDVFEIIKVESWERWREINSRQEMENIKIKFKQLVDKDSIVRLYGERINSI